MLLVLEITPSASAAAGVKTFSGNYFYDRLDLAHLSPTGQLLDRVSLP